jgi:hypothetical protein
MKGDDTLLIYTGSYGPQLVQTGWHCLSRHNALHFNGMRTTQHTVYTV